MKEADNIILLIYEKLIPDSVISSVKKSIVQVSKLHTKKKVENNNFLYYLV